MRARFPFGLRNGVARWLTRAAYRVAARVDREGAVWGLTDLLDWMGDDGKAEVWSESPAFRAWAIDREVDAAELRAEAWMDR